MKEQKLSASTYQPCLYFAFSSSYERKEIFYYISLLVVEKDKCECMWYEHYIYCTLSGSLEKRDEAMQSSTAFSSLLALLFVVIASIMERL